MNNKILMLSALISLTLFYWYSIRPSQIKHNCSWIKVDETSTPAYPAMTVDQLKESGLIGPCPTMSPKPTSGFYDKDFEKRRIEVCEKGNQKIIDQYRVARPAITTKEHLRKATTKEYSFCLHNKGLQ